MATPTAKPPRRSRANLVSPAFYRRLNQITDAFTYEELGVMTRTPPETVRRFVNGISRPTFEWVGRIARERRVSLDWLAHGSGGGPRRW